MQTMQGSFSSPKFAPSGQQPANSTTSAPIYTAASPPTLSAHKPTWDSLRASARQLESHFDSRLSDFQVMFNEASENRMSLGSLTAYGHELQEQLAKLSRIISTMTDVAESQAQDGSQSGTTMRAALNRHREVLYEYTREVQKIRAKIDEQRTHHDLFGDGRSHQDQRHGMSAKDHLLNERGRIDGAHSMTDEILSQAYLTRESLQEQWTTLRSSQSRIMNSLARFPLINDLFVRIKRRKNRDTIIMAGVISVCILLLLWYILR